MSSPVHFVFFFSQSLENEENCIIIEQLWKEICKKKEKKPKQIEISVFFCENAVYSLLNLPTYIADSILKDQVYIFTNLTHFEALIPNYKNYNIQEIQEIFNHINFLEPSIFYSKYSLLMEDSTSRILKF